MFQATLPCRSDLNALKVWLSVICCCQFSIHAFLSIFQVVPSHSSIRTYACFFQFSTWDLLAAPQILDLSVASFSFPLLLVYLCRFERCRGFQLVAASFSCLCCCFVELSSFFLFWFYHFPFFFPYSVPHQSPYSLVAYKHFWPSPSLTSLDVFCTSFCMLFLLPVLSRTLIHSFFRLLVS